MVRDDLAAGRLIHPFADKGLDCPLTQAYYVVYRPECAALPKVKALRQWLHDEARATPAAPTRPTPAAPPPGSG
ncbi:hypothetical protein KSS94_14810 [Pseudomonas fakonensis]|uniref:LysR substrate binding domain-containing protein n=2 Tax=Pseudomonas fakonensis TaxID=2842355 RepID=A0ABX8NCY2_9PSED|nr:hypothetical protein KSS94_14810 [Pseudomonas fakonensis]